MNHRAFDSIEELEEYCEDLGPNELRNVIQNGHEEYGYKENAEECAFSKGELSAMSEYLENNW